ncbi:MAG: hypothetical protein M3290_04310 [Actinomycetota bacterium]|nr:hypothetical protein [Actinomycetota bacterium]
MDSVARQHLITRSKLDDLLRKQGRVLSIYHPTEKVAVEPEENSLHLKNLVAEAASALESEGLRRPEIDSFLAPIEQLLEDRDFWLHQWSGLALFRTADDFSFFRTPYNVPETISVGDSPLLKPLLPSLWPPARFYVLALSQAQVRLLHCTRFRFREVDLSTLDVPLSLEEALRYDDLDKPASQHHPVTGQGRGQAGLAAAGEGSQERTQAFHGHGESGEGQKTQIRRWFTTLDAGLQKVLRAENAPLIVASVEYIYGLWREVTKYGDLLDERIDGNVELLNAESLHEEALPIIERRTRDAIAGLRDRFGAGVPRDLASDDLHDVLNAAADGRVDTLFVRGDQTQIGTFDVANRTVQVFYEGALNERPTEPPGDDLQETAIRLVLESSGAVYVLGAEEMPGRRPTAALFRYSPHQEPLTEPS